MAKKMLGGMEIEIDEDGFIQEPEKWSKDVAEDIAKEEASAQPMTEEHWHLVNYIRDYFQQFEVAPPIRMLCKKTGFDLKRIYDLFPKGPAAGTCKVAGLPKPTGCV
jgi:tRNA 2-thiouridine synthesizing protein E